MPTDVRFASEQYDKMRKNSNYCIAFVDYPVLYLFNLDLADVMLLTMLIHEELIQFAIIRKQILNEKVEQLVTH